MADEKKELCPNHLIKGLDFVLKRLQPWKSNYIPDYITTQEILDRIEPHYPGLEINIEQLHNELRERGYIEALDPLDGVLKWKCVERVSCLVSDKD